MNALRLLFGTLTALPVKPPASVDRRTAGWAMTLAPLAGAVLALLVGVPLALAEEYADPSPLLAAVLVIGALAVLTRAMHLDGLADTADGLGFGGRGEGALMVMRKADVGPFGVATLVLVLLVQIAALAECISRDVGALAVLLALVWSRLSVTILSTARYRAARPEGLGQLMAGSVSMPQALLGLMLALGITAGAFALAVAGDRLASSELTQHPFTVVLFGLAVLSGRFLADHAVRRVGGVTGDVYGAAVETTFTAVLLLAALA